MKATIIFCMIFVSALVVGYSGSAVAGETTLSVGDINADTYAEDEGNPDEGKQDKKDKKKKAKKEKKAKKNGKSGKNGKKAKKAKKTEETE
jgi:hypothetical protein